jgi:ABC-2 type transport system permease protein
MEFRLDFTFRIVMDLIYYAVNIAFFKVLFLHTELIGGWNAEQMMVFVGAYLLVDAVNMTVFSTNMWWLPFYINRGELDYYLIRPVAPLFFLSLREFAANSFVNLLVALGIFVYGIATYPGPWAAANLTGLVVLLLNGVLIYYCIQMLMIIPVFWTQSARGFVDLFYTLGIAMERPDRVYRGWLRIFFTVVMPFALIASYPARVFIEGFEAGMLTHLTAVSVALWLLMLAFWRRGLRSYSSASS